ncbi:ThiF family adenylyltransferase [Massilia sp. WG5]|uniref:ThiF family adenylyltransferase n=1 Tax=Massilia sp. WG5 TaxID=1707785 RepID=UPI0009EBEED6|nr:ThiF family adenylyltransferase [Massilia sp. WG5]
MSVFRFPDAVHAVESWLDGPASSFATKLKRSSTSKTLEWELELHEQGYPVERARLRIGALFPAVPCELYVAAELCLQLPHVEEDGRVCLDEECQPVDFEQPVAAVIRAISRFKTELLQRSSNVEWREKELHSERLSYWNRFCDQRQKSPRGRPRPRTTLVSMAEVDGWAEGEIAAFIPKGSRDRRIQTQVVTLGSADPVELANQHGFSSGTLVKGSAVFVRVPEEFRWSPLTWPQSFLALEQLVRAVTASQHSIAEWLSDKGWVADSEDTPKRSKGEKIAVGTRPLLVVLCHGNELYGYQIAPSVVSLVTLPHAAPIKLMRVDPTWSLTRDYSTSTFNKRQGKRVLVLGTGSLGSSVIDVLARAGIGTIDIVDSQVFGPENVSRHLLGISSILKGKAVAMAARIKKEIPGVEVRGYPGDARAWCAENCTPNKYDLVIDVTAESSVRIFLAHVRTALLGDIPVIHAWVEPHCAATHVVATETSEPWPPSDPAVARVNVADYSAAQMRINLPACSEGFHPYGSADILQAAGFSAERILDVLDNGLAKSTVWSLVRSQAFFDSLGVPITTKAIVPSQGGPRGGVMLTRLLTDVLQDV